MFSSLWSGAADPNAQNLFPVTAAFQPSEFFGELEAEDLFWTCAGGFAAETQTYYQILDDGRFMMLQVIHSSTGVWYPTVQFTFKLYDPATKEKTWRSVSVTNFVSPPPGQDKRSCKGDQFSVVHRSTSSDPEVAETYTINLNASDDLQVSWTVSRPKSIPGVKFGKGKKGGFSYFGPDTANPEGYVVHKFWPRTTGTGHIIRSGQATPIKGHGMLSHAIQGMRPNLVASKWNFGFFQSNNLGGVSAIQMEFTTCATHGQKGAGSGGTVVNIGILSVGDKVISITGEHKWSPHDVLPVDARIKSRTTHHGAIPDRDTGYDEPTKLTFEWAGPSVVSSAPGDVKAFLEMNVGSGKTSNGLIEKVDVLAELPYVVKAVINASGTKPYIYQYLHSDAILQLQGPSSLLGGKDTVPVEGTMYGEASFITQIS